MILFMFSHNTVGHIVSNEIGNQFVNYGNFNEFIREFKHAETVSK